MAAPRARETNFIIADFNNPRGAAVNQYPCLGSIEKTHGCSKGLIRKRRHSEMRKFWNSGLPNASGLWNSGLPNFGIPAFPNFRNPF